MSSNRSIRPILRAVIVLGAIGVITTAATFAALQSQQAVLAGNTIESTTADLRIGTSVSSFAASRTGFDFSGVTPGGPAVPIDGNIIYLKNYGTATLAVKAAIGTAPSNINNVNLAKTYLHISRVDTNGPDQSISLKSLIDGYTTGYVSINDTILGGVIGQYKLKISMDSDAFSGSTAAISGVDLIFMGVVN